MKLRFLEILLTLVILLAFLGLIIPHLYMSSWMQYAALIGVLLAAAQILAEGPRWQMIPAYSLTVFLFIIWLLRYVLPGGVHVSPVVSWFSIGIGVIMLIISIILPFLSPVFQFPEPTGLYAIGTVIYHWVDASRPELFSTDPNDRRELMVQVWYPAKNKSSAQRAPYIQNAEAVAPALARLFHMPWFLFTHFKYVTTNAIPYAPITDNQSSFPVLIYLTGLDGFRAASTFQIEELVSHGYIVVGLDQPGAVALVLFPDGRKISGWLKNEINPLTMQSIEPQPNAPMMHGKTLPNGILPYFAQDVSFTLDQLSKINASDPNHILTGHLDLGHVGIFGISLGGENAAEACLKDARLKACLIMDVWMPAEVVKRGLRQPCMFITRDADTMRLERERIGGWTEKDIELTLTTMRAVYESLPGDGYYLEILKMFHLNFTDAPFWFPISSQLGLTGPIRARRGSEILNAYSLAFFNKYLLDQPSSLLNGPSKQFPEVKIEMHKH